MIKKLLNNGYVKFGMIIFSIFLMYVSLKPLVANIEENYQLKKEYDKVDENYKSLNEEYKNIQSSENKDKYFREKYKLSKKGDILFVFPKEEGTQNESK